MDHQAVERVLTALENSASRELDRECDKLARRYVDEGVEPQFTVGSADFATDPRLILADRFWNLQFTAEPTLHTAVECAGWLAEHVESGYLEAVREKWTMGYGFITRGTLDSAGEIADATGDIIASDPTGGRAYFAALYHAAKLRADLRFDELYLFLESSPLAVSISGNYSGKPLFTALRAFAAFGSRRYTAEHGRALLEQAWSAPDRTRDTVDVALNGLAVGLDFDGRAELLRARATEAVSDYPDDHMFHFRLAAGYRLTGEFDSALDSIDTALRLLPAVGWRGSQNLLLEQFTAEREMIRQAQAHAHQTAELREFIDRQRHEIADVTEHYEQRLRGLADAAQRGHVRTIEVGALFVAAIAFAVGSLNVTLNGNLGLAARLWMIAGLGIGLLLFGLVIVGGTWLITRRR